MSLSSGEHTVNDKSGADNHNRQTRGFDFFRGFLREPEIVGSVIPSSRFLEEKIISAASLDNARLVVELGPGTGGTTRSFLRRMPADSTLLTIEISKAFTDLLDEIDDPRLVNHCGSAMEIESILGQYHLDSPDIVISGIPFSTIAPAVGGQILEAIWHSLRPGGHFVAYQFRGHVARLAKPVFGDPDVIPELRNIPPMRVYCWRKNGPGSVPAPEKG